jgi:hypothetical protein
MTNTAAEAELGIRHSSFVILTSFVLGHSALRH